MIYNHKIKRDSSLGLLTIIFFLLLTFNECKAGWFSNSKSNVGEIKLYCPIVGNSFELDAKSFRYMGCIPTDQRMVIILTYHEVYDTITYYVGDEEYFVHPYTGSKIKVTLQNNGCLEFKIEPQKEK